MLASGAIIDGRYVVDRWIGRGAMADVYAAKDRQTGAAVAVKILHRPLARDPQAVARFEREARAQGVIRHRNVARVFSSGVTDDDPYIVLELLNGYSLKDVIKRFVRVDVIRGCSYVWQALQGLAAAHQSGVLHRDLKPANLMLEPSPGPVERVCVIDFGFATLGDATRVTRQGEVVGSLSYMAPERLKGQGASERSDIYSMGVILYEILVGRRPFTAATELKLIAAQVDEDPISPRRANPDAGIPRQLEAVMLQSLAKDPRYRYPTADVMAAELERAAQQVVGNR